MSNLQVQRPHSQSARRKRPQSVLNDELEVDAKAYRYLFSLLADNINSIARAHRECFGEMELQARIKISREEQQSMSEQLFRIYCRFQDKLTRQPIYRNSSIRKSYSQFYASFKQHQDDPEVQKAASQLLEDKHIISENNFIIVPQPKQQKLATCFSTPAKRPMSSRAADISALTQALAGFNKTGLAQTYKMKTISAHSNQNPEGKDPKSKNLMISLQKHPMRDELFRAKKSITIKSKEMLGQRRYSNRRDEWDGFNFNGNQILISENRPKDRQSGQSENKMTPKMVENSKICSKRILNLKYSQRKSIDEIERMQIQSRIMMVNSVLSVNLPQSQGYRPKSKCWQNYFNQ